jgi:hypothetical protein
MEIIVPAAGLSSRFPNTRPKYLLFDYQSKMMLHGSLAQFLDNPDYNITVGILQEHDEKYNAKEVILRELGHNINVVILPEVTRGPAETVMKVIELANIDFAKPLFIKDCDSYFMHEISSGNYVCISKIQDLDTLSHVNNKSFVISNDHQVIQNIVEKSVVSDSFCVGGYKFESVYEYRHSYLNICNQITSEIYVSHVVEFSVSQGAVFFAKKVTDYVDVGTIQEWNKYNNVPVIFCDIDGTIIVAQSRYGTNSYDSVPIPLEANVNRIKQYQQKGSQIIFVTSRPVTAREATIKTLNALGFTEFDLLMGLNNSSRMLINDYNDANPFPRAIAVNIKRDSNNLTDFI